MGVLIGRPIEGVTINGLEYVCDEKRYAIVFKDEDDAKAFLADHNIDDELIEECGIVFEEVGDYE